MSDRPPEEEDVGMIPEERAEGISDGGPNTLKTPDRWGDMLALCRKNHIVSTDRLRLGTIEQALGAEAAEEFFSEPDPFEDARRSAAARLGRLRA